MFLTKPNSKYTIYLDTLKKKLVHIYIILKKQQRIFFLLYPPFPFSFYFFPANWGLSFLGRGRRLTKKTLKAHLHLPTHLDSQNTIQTNGTNLIYKMLFPKSSSLSNGWKTTSLSSVSFHVIACQWEGLEVTNQRITNQNPSTLDLRKDEDDDPRLSSRSRSSKEKE